MATTRKKQDDKHLKILRELVSLTANKQCFDCHQRGPTYVNMTIGSYVCTTCSGMLRGLTPPHRVKSISMATFSPEELETLKTRGNEYCRRIWLGLYDSNSQETKDEQQIKDFMIAKYEKKRYYLDPAIAATTTAPTKNGGSTTFSPNTTPTSSVGRSEAKPLASILGSALSKNLVLNMQPTSSPADNMFTPDKSPAEFLADFGTSDPFAAPTKFTAPTNNTTQASFANFDDNPIFNSFTSQMFSSVLNCGAPLPRSNRWSMPTSSTLSNMFNASFNAAPPPTSATVFQQQQLAAQSGLMAPPAEDRYAALKDLDSLMKTHQSPEPQTATAPSPHVNNGFGMSTGGSLFGSPSQTSTYQEPTANPFTGATSNPWATSSATSGHSAPPNQSSVFGMNPFQPARPTQPGYATGAVDGWPAVPVNGMTNGQVNGGHQGGVFSSSQSMNFPPKTWHNNTTANPFLLGSSPAAPGHSSNPFL